MTLRRMTDRLATRSLVAGLGTGAPGSAIVIGTGCAPTHTRHQVPIPDHP